MSGPFPHDSAERKTYPVFSGLFQYFPAALARIARHSWEGNEKHNPGEPIHWARGKSDDHLDAAGRHLIEGDLVGCAWRVLAELQLQCEAEGAPIPSGVRYVQTAEADDPPSPSDLKLQAMIDLADEEAPVASLNAGKASIPDAA